MPKKEESRGLLNADAFAKFIWDMAGKIAPSERPGFIDNVQGLGWAFRETEPTGELNLKFPDLSLANFLKTADGTTLASFALIPARIYEVARFVSKSSYENFREELREGTKAVKNIPFVYEEKKSTLTEEDSRRLYGDRVLVNVTGNRNKVMVPTNYSAELNGSYRGDIDINFPGYRTGRGGEDKKSKSAFGEDLRFKSGSKATYILEVSGELEEGSSIVRKHEDK